MPSLCILGIVMLLGAVADAGEAAGPHVRVALTSEQAAPAPRAVRSEKHRARPPPRRAV